MTKIKDIKLKEELEEKQISEILFERLKEYGVIKWHKNHNHSFYLKFRDVRLGSIRIANHPGREKYRYTYEIYKNDKDIERKIENIVQNIKEKSKTISKFNPQSFIVWDKENRGYIKVDTFNEYKDKIFIK